MKVKSLSRVRLFATQWTVAHQAPPSMGLSRQEYWSRLPFPSTGDLPDPGIEPGSPTLQADALPLRHHDFLQDGMSSTVKRLPAMWRPGFDSWVGKIPWRRKRQSTPALLPGKSHGRRSLIGYGPWGHKESDATEQLHFHFLALVLHFQRLN